MNNIKQSQSVARRMGEVVSFRLFSPQVKEVPSKRL